MKISIGNLRGLINEELQNEIGGPRAGLRTSRRGGRQQYKVGKIEDENRELSFSEAEDLFPGSTSAWAEIVPFYFKEFPFPDQPLTILKRSVFFKEGDKLTVAFADFPQATMGKWDSKKEDWDLTGDMQEACKRFAS